MHKRIGDGTFVYYPQTGFQKGGIPWNKGLTKETDKRIKRGILNRPSRVTKIFTKEIIKTSVSEREAILKVNRYPNARMYKKLRRHIKENNINVSHFNNKKRSQERAKHLYKPSSHYLGTDKPISSRNLAIKLLKEGIFERKCYKCGRCKWLGQLIWLQLHHKDGNKKNNSLDNLELLCPNCHSTTNNFCFKGRTHTQESIEKGLNTKRKHGHIK